MSSPQLSQFELQRIYPQFLGKIRGDLRLDSQEESLVKQTDPIIWAQWAVSALAGDESVAYPHKEDVRSFLPERALPFFAKEVEINGTQPWTIREES